MKSDDENVLSTVELKSTYPGAEHGEEGLEPLNPQEERDNIHSSPGNEDFDLKESPSIWNGNNIAVGLLMDNIALSPLATSYVSISVAILSSVEEEVGCTDLPRNIECDAKIWGVKPSSLVTLSSGIMGLAVCIFMPLAGAIVDYSKERRKIGYWTGICLVVFNAAQLDIIRGWRIPLLFSMVGPPVYFLHSLISLAYYPSLSSDPKLVAKFISSFEIGKFVMNTLFLSCLIFTAREFHADDITSAFIGQLLAVTVSLPFMHFSWRDYLPNSPQLNQKPSGEWYLIAGLNKIRQTYNEIKRVNEPMKWFFIAIAFANPSQTSFVLILPTFTKVFLNMSTGESALVLLIFNLSTALGARCGSLLCCKKDPIFGSKMFLIFAFVTSFLCVLITKGPYGKSIFFIYLIISGICVGGYFTCESTLMTVLTPRDQEAEIMGIYIFVIRMLLWFPPLIFTGLNENGVGLNKAIAVIQCNALLAAFLLSKMGAYDEVMAASITHKSQRNTCRINLEISTASDSELL